MTKEELIEQYRDFNVEHIEWWDCTYDHFKEDMSDKHIRVDDICFSGFCCQGDGASFTGLINNLEFLKAHDLVERYPYIMRLVEYGGDFTLRIERISAVYAHENTVAVELSFTDMFYNVLPCGPDDTLRAEVVAQWDALLDEEYTRLADDVTSIIRDYCRDLYRRLNDEYDYLTSDEAVWEAIVANDLDAIEDEEEENV
jgi:hypothetical protein